MNCVLSAGCWVSTPHNYEPLGVRSLNTDELAPGLMAVLEDEVDRGLDPAKRVAMIKQLG